MANCFRQEGKERRSLYQQHKFAKANVTDCRWSSMIDVILLGARGFAGWAIDIIFDKCYQYVAIDLDRYKNARVKKCYRDP